MNIDDLRLELKIKNSPFTSPIIFYQTSKGCFVEGFVDSEKNVLYFSEDGVYFLDVTPNNLQYSLPDIQEINGCFVRQSNDGIYFSEDGVEWNFVENEEFNLHSSNEAYDYFQLLNICSNGENFVILCSDDYNEEVGGWISRTETHKTFYLAIANRLDGAIEWLDDFEGLDGCEIAKITFKNGFYRTYVSEYDCDESSKRGAYWSRDGVHWHQADEDDLEDFEDLDFNDDDDEYYWKAEDKPRYDNYNNQIYFRLKGNLLTASTDSDMFAHYQTVATLPFDTAVYGHVACVGNILHIFGANGEWATAEIKIK